jgi:aryl-alcohol dehydrogenase-like predicted oxidoreductase
MQSIKRREFLTSAVAGTAGVLLAGSLTKAAAPESAAPAKAAPAKAAPAKAAPAKAAPAKVNLDPTALVPLGKNLKVCRIGAGTGMNGGYRASNQTKMGKEQFEALLRYEYDQNVRLFDCADLYGTHPYVARVLKSKPRDSFQLVTKIWFHRQGLPETERPDADICVKRFLQELQVEYIDLVQIHCMMSPDWPKEMRKQMDIMQKLKKEGKIRAHGVSVHSLEALKAAAEEPWVDVIHVRLNHLGERMDGSIDDVVPIVKAAHKNGKGIIAMKVAGESKFDEKQRQESIHWLLGLGCVDAMVCGFERLDHVDEFKRNVRKKLVAMAQGRREAVLA